MRPIKLFLDDLRTPPTDDFLLARNESEFILAMYKNPLGFEEIWFDNDLGVGNGSGNRCLEHLIDECEHAEFPHPKRIVIHTMNPVENRAMMQRAKTYFTEVTKVERATFQ